MKKTILALTLSVVSISTYASQFVSLVSIESAEIKKQVIVEKIGEVEKNFTEWKNAGEEYDCFVVRDIFLTEIEKYCWQDQERTKDIYSVYSDNSESFDERITETQKIVAHTIF
ncbi:hypothetical protein [Vibrio sp. Isolate24]|uniref:hypothetical protein n=1 Tax=Vibrio sp. Isolate24 TaxID=2908534 RepID=UPI001EFDFAF1|nr:hypothetical protein [Vibrio sp. Isolate24]MCG9680491.1 hypothetical protein [Vibrio sp. Isolate24]